MKERKREYSHILEIMANIKIDKTVYECTAQFLQPKPF